MASNGHVVHETRRVSEAEFHDALVVGLARAAKAVGRGTLADRMEISGRGLDKIFAGSCPSAKRAWDALAGCPTALDDIAELYGKRVICSKKVVIDEAKTVPALVAALHKIVEAEADGIIDHRELLDMEREVIAAEQALQVLRARISAVRKPRQVA